MRTRSALAAGARPARSLALACCLLLVLAQIGALTHALSHYRTAPSASVASSLDAAANTDQDLAAADNCAICLAFGVLSNAILPTLLALTAVAIAVSALAAILPAPALAAPRGYRARAPPSLLAF